MTKDKKRALMASMGLLALGELPKMPNDTTLAYVPDTRSVPELFDSGEQIYDGPCCQRCEHRFGDSNHKYCMEHCNDEKCSRFKLEK